LDYKIILELVANVQGKRHVINMDNSFISIGLFEELALRKIYAISMMKKNQVGLPLALIILALSKMYHKAFWNVVCMNHDKCHLLYGKKEACLIFCYTCKSH
jgi:hypothetical protein